MIFKRKPKILFKSLPANMSPNGHLFEIKKWYKEDKIKICQRGYHASKRAIDAMQYVNCEVLAKVEVRGDHEEEDNKQCWSEIKILETYKWTKQDSVALSIFAAEFCLNNFEKVFPDDKRPREAIEAAKKVLENDTEENRSAAEAAAAAAAWSAWSAWSAAAAAAAAAAWSARSAAAAAAAAAAARSAAAAARSAAAAARSAADKILDKCEIFIQDRVKFN